MNTVAMIGNMTRDPELRYTQSGKAVVNFGIAVNKYNGEADFFNVTAWEKQAEAIAQYTHKGSKVGVEGRLQSRSYEYNGEKRTAVDILAQSVEFLDPPTGEGKTANVRNSRTSSKVEQDFITPEDDDLPF